MGMRFGAAFWVQRTGWPELREAVLRAEAAGFDDLWIDDHLLSDEGDWPDPKLEGWTTLAAVAAVTERARLGHMVSANTLRNPGLMAKMATTIDHVSGGRAILGIGAGWFEREHEAFGFDFGSGFGERLDRLAEAVPLMRRLLDGETGHARGALLRVPRRRLRAAPGPGPPADPDRRARDRRKTMPLVARYADMWNVYGTPDEVAAADAILRGACEAVGRDEREIERTVNLNVVIRPSRAEAERGVGGLARGAPAAERRGALDAGGPVEEVAAALARYRDVGFAHPILIFRTPWDLETMEPSRAARGPGA